MRYRRRLTPHGCMPVWVLARCRLLPRSGTGWRLSCFCGAVGSVGGVGVDGELVGCGVGADGGRGWAVCGVAKPDRGSSRADRSSGQGHRGRLRGGICNDGATGVESLGSTSGLRGSGVAASAGQVASVGSLSVPQGWATANQAVVPAAHAANQQPDRCHQSRVGNHAGRAAAGADDLRHGQRRG